MVETDGAVLERMVELTTGKAVGKTPRKKGATVKKAAAGKTARRKRSKAAA
jgi:hypothetical protein